MGEGGEEDERTSVDVQVDPASVLAGSIEISGTPVSAAEEEPSTSRLALRAPATSLALRECPSDAPRGAEDEPTDDSDVSLLTPRLDAEDLARQLALSEDAPPTRSDEEDENGDLWTKKRKRIRDSEPMLDHHMAADGHDDEETLDARAGIAPTRSMTGPPMPSAPASDDDHEDESVRTERRERPTAQANDVRGEALQLPPMRPRLDSEAAGQWPPWHAQPEEARAALIGVASPVASGTEILPQTAVAEAFRMAAAQASMGAKPARSPGASAPRKETTADPLAHRLDAAPPDEPAPPARASSSPSSSARSAGSTPSAAAKRGISPFAVFVLAFLFTGGAFAGVIASRRLPLFYGETASTPIASADTSVTPPASEAPPAPSSAVASSSATSAPASGAAPVATATATAPSASASAARPKTKGAPRPRGKVR